MGDPELLKRATALWREAYGHQMQGDLERAEGFFRRADVERLYETVGLPPQVAAAASRVAVPVYRNSHQVGRATSTTWSPVLKKLIALATIDAPHFNEGTSLEFEVTIEGVRHRVPAAVTRTPFFNPPRKTAPLA